MGHDLTRGLLVSSGCVCSRLVVNTTKSMAADRKCFRLIGGVLVERTVGEVIPAVQANMDGVSLRIALACTTTHN